mmetsp:Transcript_40934/g.107495  ORF Transcript_40934/g.107495 Transcript_40934/m.107495 type:complete len:367 (+) Transcript_40934:19-1119(+)
MVRVGLVLLASANGSAAESCTPCSVTFGDRTFQAQCRATKEDNVPTGAKDLPGTVTDFVCPSEPSCALASSRPLAGKVPEVVSVPADAGFTPALQQQVVDFCTEQRTKGFANVHHSTHPGNSSPRGWKSRHTGTVFPDALYQQVANQLCAGAGAWGPIRVTRMWCNLNAVGQKDLRHWHYNKEGTYNFDPMNQGNGVYYVKVPDVKSNGGAVAFSYEEQDPANPVAVTDGDLVLFPSTMRHEVLPHQQEGFERVSIAINYVTDDLFRAGYKKQWFFDQGFGPLMRHQVDERMQKNKDSFDRYQKANATKVVELGAPAPIVSLKRPWPVAVLYSTDSKLIEDFKKIGKRRVQSQVGPIDLRLVREPE